MKRWLVFLVAALTMGWAYTQQSSTNQELARIVEVEGLVTVTNGNQLISGAVDTKLIRGSRVATASGAAAVIEFRSGCRIRIGANETHSIDDEDCCGALFAVVPLIALAPAGAVAGAIATPALLTGATAGVLGVTALRTDSALSGS